jgi:CHAD domain-containing protein
MAHALTPMLATQFFEAGDAAAEASSSGNDLHRFRIRTKKFRYTLELFTPVFGPALENEFASLREIQTRLGDINDCVATAALLDDFKKCHADAVRRSKRVLARSAALKMSGFREFWTKSFSQQQKAAWIAHLTSNDLSGVTPK